MNGIGQSVILCIDDEPDALSLRRQVLERAGHEVLSAMSARAALALFRDNDVDLVLLEHMVTDCAGGTLATEMKRLKPKIPILIYSSAVTLPVEARHSADRFVTKLAPIDELLHIIENMLPRSPKIQTGKVRVAGRPARSKREHTPEWLQSAS